MRKSSTQLIFLLVLFSSIASVTLAIRKPKPITIHKWTGCRDKALSEHEKDPCQNTTEFTEALNEFNDYTYPGASDTMEECENYHRK